jgi:hypothetical protein
VAQAVARVTLPIASFPANSPSPRLNTWRCVPPLRRNRNPRKIRDVVNLSLDTNVRYPAASARLDCSLGNRLARRPDCRSFVSRAALLLLLLAVPTLSTLAKNSWYLPQTDTGHYLTGAVKMKASCSPVVIDREPLRLIGRVIPPRPQFRMRREERLVPPRTLISLTICLQHRSPPSFT